MRSKNMRGMNRRRFIQSTSGTALAFALVAVAGTKASGRVLGANDAIGVGMAGIHGQGSTTSISTWSSPTPASPPD